MTIARRQLVDLTITRYYHCISRCVRRAMLCGEGFEHRKKWVEDRLQHLSRCFAVSVCGFSVMDNHLHLLVRLDPQSSVDWSDEEVVRRWIGVYPPRNLDLDDADAVRTWVEGRLGDSKQIEVWRQRLQDLGWFMKALKEPLARMANREDDCKGTFWESRYKSIAILDQEALLATCAYIDLNPVAAGIAANPESSRFTSVRQRVLHAKQRGKLSSLKSAAIHSIAGSRAEGRFEESHWLCPLNDTRRRGGKREGMLENFSLGSYLQLVDYTGRLCRAGKVRVSRKISNILQRLGTTEESWGQRLRQLFSKSRLNGSYFATRRSKLLDVAHRRGVHHIDNTISLPLTG